MRRLARLHKPSPITSSLTASSRLSASTSVRCSQARDISKVAQRPRVARSTASSPRTPIPGRSLSDTPALRQKQEQQTASQTTGLEAVRGDELEVARHLIDTDLTVPGDIRPVPSIDDLSGTTYTPAESVDGLEWVGGLDDWWENDQHWGASKKYAGFGPSERVADPALLEVLTRRAVVEALAVRKGAPQGVLSTAWRVGGQDRLLATLEVEVDVSEDGSADLKGDFMDFVQGLTAEGQGAVGANDWSLSPQEAREVLKSWDKSWKQTSLEDPRLLFAVTKRLQQLTGHVIPDAKLLRVQTVSALLGALVKPPKAKRLAKLVETKGILADLPNVKFYPRRVTPLDKEKMAGRWKVIARELEKRELPLTGTGKYTKSIEVKWASGLA